MTTQTQLRSNVEAERLAGYLDDCNRLDLTIPEAAAELRRLVSFNNQLMDEVARLNKEALHKLAAKSLTEGLRLDDWDKIGCVNHDCDKCKAQAEQPAQQEPVLWQILNGVCHAGIRSTENLAKETAAGMQKTHDLGGSLAAFHVRPLYTSPPASKPWVGLTEEEVDDLSREMVKGNKSVNWLAHAIEAKLREENT